MTGRCAQRAFLSLLFLGLILLAPASWAEQGQQVIAIKNKSGRQVGSYTYRESHALVVGVSDYTGGWPPLVGVKKDIKAVTQALENHGFHVVVVENPNQDELEKSYRDFILTYGLERDNRLLFYFAGHGYTVKPSYATNDPEEKGWMGYIVSRNAPVPGDNLGPFLRHALSMQRFADMALEIQAKHALFLFDSCFSGAIFALSVPISGGITLQTAEPVRQFISSGSADQSVPDESEFRRQLIAALGGAADRNGDGYVTGSELGLFLQEKVTLYSNRAQTPQYGTIRDPRLDKGDFVFPVTLASQPPVIKPLPPDLRPAMSNSMGMEFVLIPAGEFTMGADERPASPVHRVTITQPFYLSKYEVTQAQWAAVMGNNPSYFKGDSNLPVEQVSWDEVQEFVRKLNAKEGGNRYRLPTEAEWEWAARAGSIAAYSFGDDPGRLGEYAWYEENSGKRTHAVGQLKPNAWGIYDLHGNVWEWCQDWYGDYPTGAVTDPQGAPRSAYRVYRGGGWQRGASTLYCRVASRQGGRPGFRHAALGFRLLMTPPLQSGLR